MSDANRTSFSPNVETVGTQTAIRVPVPDTPIHLAGILQSTNHGSRRLGLICHGSLGNNPCKGLLRCVLIYGEDGHKNYLFQPTLANDLAPPFGSTFVIVPALTHLILFSTICNTSGNGESDGEMGYSNWEDDQADLGAVIGYFERQGYYIYALIGHSRGALSTLNYAAVSNHVPMIPYIISISSRFHMADVKRKHGPELMGLLEKQVVPVRDIGELQSHLSHARTALRIITNADHNYRKQYNEVSQVVAGYFSTMGRKEEWSRRVLPNWKSWVHAIGGVLNFRTVGDIWIPSTTDGTVSYLRPGIIYRCAEYGYAIIVKATV
ncbi:hypothetical protein BGX31_004857 [Mortierella sp. GBA43]|nr:hypothetical protein BGX31_004857 [Mortierella sp. GBA43]